MRLIINNQEIELDQKTRIIQTKQNNDIASIETRQTHFTDQFDIPKTAHNIKAFDFLGMVGNTSNTPYQKNECHLYSDAGDCLIYSGWANITETTNVYKCHIYDGILEIYKAIENYYLSDLDLQQINHVRNLSTVTNSWTNDTYRYILADYNGKMFFSGTPLIIFNIDYLVPSVNVKYLWDKIFNQFGFTYTGSFFQKEDFTNLWMTYPKGVVEEQQGHTVFKSSHLDQNPNSNDAPCDVRDGIVGCFFKYRSCEILEVTPVNDTHLYVHQTGKYKITLTGTVKALEVMGILVAKNSVNKSPLDVTEVAYLKKDFKNNGLEEPVKASVVIEINKDESICLVLMAQKAHWGFGNLAQVENDKIVLEIEKIEDTDIDFQGIFSDFSIKDFFKEILNRFGLSIFKDKYTNNYHFLTMEERLKADVVDLSELFVEKTAENYKYGSYGQRNLFRHQYNDSRSTYNNGMITIANANLDPVKDLIESKIFSPEHRHEPAIHGDKYVYPMYGKEPQEGTTQLIRYKSLDNRFYFLRSKSMTMDLRIGSEATYEIIPVTHFPIENFDGLSYADTVKKYYSEIQTILNKSKVSHVLLRLTEKDLANLDYKKLYYFKQLGGYFLLNKVIAFESGKLTNCEMVKVEKGVAHFIINEATLQFLSDTGNQKVYFIHIDYTSALASGTSVTIFIKEQGASDFVGKETILGSSVWAYVFNTTSNIDYVDVYIEHQGITSNTVRALPKN